MDTPKKRPSSITTAKGTPHHVSALLLKFGIASAASLALVMPAMGCDDGESDEKIEEKVTQPESKDDVHQAPEVEEPEEVEESTVGQETQDIGDGPDDEEEVKEGEEEVTPEEPPTPVETAYLDNTDEVLAGLKSEGNLGITLRTNREEAVEAAYTAAERHARKCSGTVVVENSANAIYNLTRIEGEEALYEGEIPKNQITPYSEKAFPGWHARAKGKSNKENPTFEFNVQPDQEDGKGAKITLKELEVQVDPSDVIMPAIVPRSELEGIEPDKVEACVRAVIGQMNKQLQGSGCEVDTGRTVSIKVRGSGKEKGPKVWRLEARCGGGDVNPKSEEKIK